MAEGLFGSNVGGKASQRMLPLPAPAPMVVKFPHVSEKAAPKIHVSALHLTQAQMGTSSSSGGSISGFSKATPVGSPAASSGGGGLLGGVEGFIGHLSSDIVHTAMGMPVGLMYLANHPIAGAEGMVKATWADWSPLFHGNVDQWSHNFYEHPLAPILDLVGFASFGAGSAARVAGGLAKLGDATDAASIAGKLAKFSNPMKVATAENMAATEAKFGAATYIKDPLQGVEGSLTKEAAAHFEHLQMTDARINHLVQGPAGDVMAERWSRNPLVRATTKGKIKAGNALADRSPMLSKIVGDQAVYKRWSFLDKGRRSAAASTMIQKEIASFSKAGDYSSKLSVAEKARMLVPGINKIMHGNARGIRSDVTPEWKTLQAHDLIFLKDPAHMTEDIAKMLSNADHAEAMGIAHDVVLKDTLRFMGKIHTTKDASLAMRDAGGRLQVVSNVLQHRLANEVLSSDMVIRKLYQEPIQVWRHMLLGLSPRYFVNNFIGNSLMLIAATDPISLVKAYRNHMRLVHGASAEADFMDATDRAMAARQIQQIRATPSGGGAWNSKAAQVRKVTKDAEARINERAITNAAHGGNYGIGGKVHRGLNPMEQHVAGEFKTMTQSVQSDEKAGSLVTRAMNVQVKGHKLSAYEITNRWADEPGRYMAANYSLMRTPEYQLHVARLLGKGMSHERASLIAARDSLKMEGVRTTVAMQVKHMLGQYHTFHSFEKGIKKNVVPFYSWYRALAVHVRHIATQETYKAAMGAALGAQGNKVQAQMLGQVPDFMQAMIPGALLGGFVSDMAGRKAVFNATTMSPYGTVSDLTNMVMAATGQGGKAQATAGESLGSAVNPALQGIMEYLTGTSLQTGTPVTPAKGGIAGAVVSSLFQGLPQVKLLGDVLGTTDTSNMTHPKSGASKPTLYAHGLQADLTSFLGVPIKQVSPQAASALKDKQDHKKKTYLPTSFPGL